ncbi:hypothetical protein [Altererythrobacter sp. GH1-8]|uniref:hypothetical protein n=1 Tax=Altererythrobacter sp. GH1-8 TaxID=3349333 RepID=UPI00374D8786
MTYKQVYRLPTGDRIRQGEVLAGVPVVTGLSIIDEETNELLEEEVSLAVVVTPDCDIENYERRLASNGDGGMTSFMLLPLMPRSQVSSTAWKNAHRNSQTSAHVIESCPSECDAAELGFEAAYIDFRWLFAIHPEFLKSALAADLAIRRTQICSPYREHLIQRLMANLSRVALDRDHDTE